MLSIQSKSSPASSHFPIPYRFPISRICSHISSKRSRRSLVSAPPVSLSYYILSLSLIFLTSQTTLSVQFVLIKTLLHWNTVGVWARNTMLQRKTLMTQNHLRSRMCFFFHNLTSLKALTLIITSAGMWNAKFRCWEHQRQWLEGLFCDASEEE